MLLQLTTLSFIVVSLVVFLLTFTYAQVWPNPVTASANGNRHAPLRNSANFADGAQLFSLEFLTQVSNFHIHTTRRSYMVSPFAVWSLLLLLNEGAENKTLKELQDTLYIGSDRTAIRSMYQQIKDYLTVNTTTIKSATFQALFTDINKPINPDFERLVTMYYGSDIVAVDFLNINHTVSKINDDINKATQGLLPYTVQPQDFKDANLLMISSLYFKGKWRYPFEMARTHMAPFYDEQGTLLGNVQMMTQTGPFTYVGIKEIESHVLELPYGNLNRLSMLIILPKRGVSVNRVVNDLRSLKINEILRRLNAAAADFQDEPVEVFMPKFTTESHFSLRSILTNMGIADVFEPAFANLNKISKDVFVSSIFHSTRIICNEEGTEAAAVTAATLANKATPPKFYVDRPFLYLIVEKTANLLLFAGEIKSNI